MQLVPTSLNDAFRIVPEPIEDQRGFFARTWCQATLEDQRLDVQICQCSHSYNRYRGTLRGMHFQRFPYQETKLVRCIAGAIYDVIVDLRPTSPTYLKWEGFSLTADNRHALYVPKGFAHGFLTLRDQTEVQYQISEFYHPDHTAGFHYADPEVGIRWPATIEMLSDRDRTLPLVASVVEANSIDCESHV